MFKPAVHLYIEFNGAFKQTCFRNVQVMEKDLVKKFIITVVFGTTFSQGILEFNDIESRIS